MRRLLTGFGLLGCLGVAGILGIANPGFAFPQEVEEQPDIPQQEAQDQKEQAEALEEETRDQKEQRDRNERKARNQQEQIERREQDTRDAQEQLERREQDTQKQPSDSHTGMYDALGQGYFRMTINGRKYHLHNLSDQTQVLIDGQPARLTDIKTGDRIRVTMGPNNVAMRIEVMRQRGQERSASETQDEVRQRPDLDPRDQERTTPRTGEDSRQRPDFQNSDREANRQEADQPTPWLGVMLNEAREGQGGVQISRIYPSGPAARAGFYSGDVLVEIAGKKVQSPDEAAKIIGNAKMNEPIEFVVLRGEQRQIINAFLADRRDFLFDFGGRSFERQEGQEGREGQEGSADSGHDRDWVPDHAMMLEQHRRFAEQHERIERKLDQVLNELADLRRQMGTAGRPGGRAPGRRGPDGQFPDRQVPDQRPPGEETPAVETPEIETPDRPRPNRETPASATPDRPRPERDTPATERPEAEQPETDNESPAAERPEADTEIPESPRR